MATIFFLLTFCVLGAMIYFQARRSYDDRQKQQAWGRRASSAARRGTQMHWFYDDILSRK